MPLEISRTKEGGFNISGMYYSQEEAAKIKDFIEVEEFNDHVHELGEDAYREKYNGEEP
tara:strand:+ start:354 stop:530 length:177 start_codon:yes stop_codon:yes gene_type:complete